MNIRLNFCLLLLFSFSFAFQATLNSQIPIQSALTGSLTGVQIASFSSSSYDFYSDYQGDGHNIESPGGGEQKGDFFDWSDSVTSDFSDSENPAEIIQMFQIIRNGVCTDYNFLYEGEYSAYKMMEGTQSLEQLTPLGKAQCWALGRNLAISYPEFISGVIDKNSFTFQLVKVHRTRVCAKFIWYGMQDYVPFIGYFSDDLVQEALMRRGNCHACSSDSQFPYEESQSLSEGKNNELYDTDNLEEHPDEFYDLDDNCKKVYKFTCNEVGNFPLADVAIFKQINNVMFEDEFQEISALNILQRHLYHGLPLEKGLEFLSSMTIKRALKSKDITTSCFLKSVLDVTENDWKVPAVYSRSLIKNIREKLDSESEELTVYVAHNDNLIGLLAYLLGAKGPLKNYMPYYASNIQILVYYESDTDTEFVKIRFDGREMEIRDCQGQCSLEQFEALLEVYEELGGKMKEWCHA